MKNGRKLKKAQKRLKNATSEKMRKNKELSLVKKCVYVWSVVFRDKHFTIFFRQTDKVVLSNLYRRQFPKTKNFAPIYTKFSLTKPVKPSRKISPTLKIK